MSATEMNLLSPQNLNYLYTSIQSNVINATNVDIKTNATIQTTIKDVAQKTYRAAPSKELEALNNHIITNITSAICEKIAKKKGKKQNALTTTHATTGQPIERKTRPEDDREYRLQPFTMSADFQEFSHYDATDESGTSVNQIPAANINPIELMKRIQQEREEETNRYLKKLESNTLATGENFHLNREIDKGKIVDAGRLNDPLDLYRKTSAQMNDYKTNALNTMDHQDIITPDECERDIRINLQRQVLNMPKYIEKTFYLSVNSIDRDWVNYRRESRYNFKVSFNPSSTSPTAGIQTILKNIISVEVIGVQLPIDYTNIQFDSRIALNALRFPYMVLNIDELDEDIYYGTNKHNNNCFAVLMFDKEYSTQVLSTDYINTQVQSNPKTKYNLQYKRGYFKYISSFFEKKKYYNNPKASLTHMTINITDPAGSYINTQEDTLEILDIEGETIGDKEISTTTGFPYYNSSTQKYIKITTNKYFYNRNFRIGDSLRFRHVVSNSSAFNEYINRDAGHVIINLQLEDNTGIDETRNKGLINVLYISPMGQLNALNQTLDESTYIDVDTLVFSEYENSGFKGYAINMDLQTHLMFKVITKNIDSSIINTQNI